MLYNMQKTGSCSNPILSHLNVCYTDYLSHVIDVLKDNLEWMQKLKYKKCNMQHVLSFLSR